MKLITQNPYRVLGILSSASTREVEKQKSKIARFTSAGKEVESDYDFNFLGSFERTDASIAEALSEIEQNPGKVNHSLFWYVENGSIDKTALEHIKNGEIDKAIEIWKKTLEHRDIGLGNYSAANNLGTLLMSLENSEFIPEGVGYKFKLIESNYFRDFISLVADSTYKIEKEEQVKQTVAQMMKGFEGIQPATLFSQCPESVQKSITSKVTENPVSNIESRIDSAKAARKKDPTDAYNIGLELYNSTKQDILSLRSAIGSEAVEFKLIADNLAKEILQCGIDYFKEHSEKGNPVAKSIELCEYAKELALADHVKERINENFLAIKEWGGGQASEEEREKCGDEIDAVTKALDESREQASNLDNAVKVLKASHPHLLVIKETLGANNEFYLSLTSAVVNTALNMVIEIVNSEQTKINKDSSRLSILSGVVNRSVSIMNAMNKLEMNEQTRTRFSENNRTIRGIKSQIDSAKTSNSGGDAVNVIRIIVFIAALCLFAARACT
ncbi:MAG: hypothetical protein ABJG68_04885 [Crocinitomicaceae bacterium]